MSESVLARVEDVPVGGAIVVGAGADGILLARGDGDAAIAAYRNRCPHAGFSFARADGSVLVQEGRYIVCPVHGASFALATGACAGGPCDGDALTPIAITIRSGLICGV